MIKVHFNSVPVEKDFSDYTTRLQEIHEMIHHKNGLGNQFLGWLELPENYNRTEWQEMTEIAAELKQEIEVLLVIGIGGSYLGARAAIEMINGLYSQNDLEIVYLGNTISSTYTKQVLSYVENKKFGIVVISKSGTTTEPAIAFRLAKNLLEQQVGKEKAKQRIIAITDAAKGALKTLATKEYYRTFIIPDDIGGRYSVLTPVGIFVMLMAGVDVQAVINGAHQAYKDTLTADLTNEAYRYALARYLLNVKTGYKVEMLVSYEMQMQMFSEWWKQLFGESEGKNNKGLLPTSCIFSTDLHSLGQFIQEGTKNLLFETILTVNEPPLDVVIPASEDNLDGLNYLTGRSWHEINQIAQKGVLQAHAYTGNIPNIVLELSQMDATMFGYLSYWFMKACTMSAYLLEINPFDQPGVEIYKQNMFHLLGKK